MVDVVRFTISGDYLTDRIRTLMKELKGEQYE